MNLQEFEKTIRTGLQNQKVDLDTDLFMQRLFEPKKKTRRILFFWWMLGSVSVGLASMFLFMKNSDSGIDTMNNSTQKVSLEKALVTTQGLGMVLTPENTGDKKITNHSKVLDNNTVKQEGLVGQGKNNTIDVINSRNSEIINTGKEENHHVVSVYESNLITNSTEKEKARSLVHDIQSLDIQALEALSKPKYKIKKTVECPSFSVRKKISFFIQPEFGLSLPQKSLQESSPDISEVTNYRKENEKSLEGIHASLLAGCFIGKSSFYVNTGLSYGRLTEKLDLTYNYTRRDTSFGIISITKSQSGDTVTVIYGDIVTESTVQGQKIRHHYFHTWDIPLTVGYQFALGSKWNLHLEGGLLFNIRLNTTGQVLNSLQDFKPISKNEYQTSLGLGYKAGCGIEYLIQPNIGFGLQGRIQGYGKTFTSPNSNFQQKYMIPGAHCFLRYYFTM